MDFHVTVGTRPEIITMSDIIRSCRSDPAIEIRLIHFGQHYSRGLSDVFFEELDIPEPDVNLGVGSGTHAEQTGRMITNYGNHLTEDTPDVVLAHGDTNSVLATAITCSKLPVAFGHVEAGLRSGDWSMPEETNRMIADRVADYCFAPTETAVQNLRQDGIADDRIHHTGNPTIEITRECLNVAERMSSVHHDLDIAPEEDYIVLTCHREKTVTARERLEALLDGVRAMDDPVIFPIHPGTAEKLRSFGLYSMFKSVDSLILTEPLGYLDFLYLCARSSLIVTDSGGIQEEVTVYKTPILVIRDTTEWPETLERFGELVSLDQGDLAEKIDQYLDTEMDLSDVPSPYIEEGVSERILKVIDT